MPSLDSPTTAPETDELAALARELFAQCDVLDPELRSSLGGLLAMAPSDDRVLDLLEAAADLATALGDIEVAATGPLGEEATQMSGEYRTAFSDIDGTGDDAVRSSLVIAADREEQTDALLDRHEARAPDPDPALVARSIALTEQALRLQGALVVELRRSDFHLA